MNIPIYWQTPVYALYGFPFLCAQMFCTLRSENQKQNTFNEARRATAIYEKLRKQWQKQGSVPPSAQSIHPSIHTLKYSDSGSHCTAVHCTGRWRNFVNETPAELVQSDDENR
jgi:hypothetical protein